MNADRESYAPRLPLDWGASANRFRPLTERTRTVVEHRDAAGNVTAGLYFARRAPMAVRRTLPAHKVEALKARWFAFGSLTTSAVLGAGWLLVQMMGWWS